MKEEVLPVPTYIDRKYIPDTIFPLECLHSARHYCSFLFFFFFSLPLGPFSTSDKRLADGRMTRENDATYPHAIYQPPPHKRTPEPGALFGITMLIVRSMPRKMPGKWKKHREWANRWVSETVLLRIKQFFFSLLLFSRNGFFREI